MKKIVYIIISFMALVLYINLSHVSKNNTLQIKSDKGFVEINPVY